MNGFKFRLKKVLNVRKIKEEIAENKFLAALNKKLKLEKELKKTKLLKDEIYCFLREESLKLDEIIRIRESLQHIFLQIDQLEIKIREQEKEVQRCQENLLEKKQKREVLEKLSSKEKEAFYKEILANEQKEIDEIAVSYFSGGKK